MQLFESLKTGDVDIARSLTIEGKASKYVFQNTGLVYDVEFRDEMELQKTIVDLSVTEVELDKWEPKEFLAVLEIIEVYPGAKWDDTCIAEIQFR